MTRVGLVYYGVVAVVGLLAGLLAGHWEVLIAGAGAGVIWFGVLAFGRWAGGEWI